MKIRPVRAEVFYADCQMDRLDEANSSFSQIFRMHLKKKKKTITEGYKLSLAALKRTTISRSNVIPQNRGMF